MEREVTVEEVNAAMKKAAEGEMKGILQYCEDPIVSVDIIHNSHSSIYDSQSVMVIGNMVKVLTGRDKNKSGEIIEIINTLNKAKVKGINIVKKHLKTTKEKKGGIISKENFIHLSNLKRVEKKENKTAIKKEINKK